MTLDDFAALLWKLPPAPWGLSPDGVVDAAGKYVGGGATEAHVVALRNVAEALIAEVRAGRTLGDAVDADCNQSGETVSDRTVDAAVDHDDARAALDRALGEIACED